MELRQITPLALSEFILELQQAGAGAATIRSCLGLLQSMFARAVERDRASANVVKLIAKPRAPRVRAIKPLRPVVVEALRRQMLRNHDHGLRDATLVSVLAYAGLRPEEALALEYQHVRKATILVEQKWIDGEIVPGQKTARPPVPTAARRAARRSARVPGGMRRSGRPDLRAPGRRTLARSRLARLAITRLAAGVRGGWHRHHH